MDNVTIINELLAEVDGLQRQLEVMGQKIAGMKQRLALAEVSMQADAAALKASQLRVKQLEIVVAGLQSQIASSEPVQAASREEHTSQIIVDCFGQPGIDFEADEMLDSVTTQEEVVDEEPERKQMENLAETSVENPVETPTDAPVRSEIKDARLISDLRKAIGLNDRFRFKNDLFDNNETLLWDTIDALNALDSMSEAKAYLQTRFSWSDDNATVVYFYEILERKFVRP